MYEDVYVNLDFVYLGVLYHPNLHAQFAVHQACESPGPVSWVFSSKSDLSLYKKHQLHWQGDLS